MKSKCAGIILLLFFCLIIVVGFQLNDIKAEYETGLMDKMAVVCARDYFSKANEIDTIEDNIVVIKKRDLHDKYLMHVSYDLSKSKDKIKEEYLMVLQILDVYGQYAYYPNALIKVEDDYDLAEKQAMSLNYWNIDIK